MSSTWVHTCLVPRKSGGPLKCRQWRDTGWSKVNLIYDSWASSPEGAQGLCWHDWERLRGPGEPGGCPVHEIICSQLGIWMGSTSRKANRPGRSAGVRRVNDEDDLRKVIASGYPHL